MACSVDFPNHSPDARSSAKSIQSLNLQEIAEYVWGEIDRNLIL
jgi:hypothetical protein